MRLLVAALALHSVSGQDWDALGAVKLDARLRVSLRAGRPLDGPFGGYTPSQIKVAARPVERVQVTRVEGYRTGVWSRWKRAGVTAAIGAGAGFAIGAAGGGCRKTDLVCFSRAETGAVVGAAGGLIGFTSFVVIPPRTRYTIYRSR